MSLYCCWYSRFWIIWTVFFILLRISFKSFIDYCDLENQLQDYAFVFIEFCCIILYLASHGTNYPYNLSIKDMAEAVHETLEKMKIEKYII